MAQDLSLLFTLKAKNEAAPAMKAVEAQIASLRKHIQEIKADKDPVLLPFKTDRLEAANRMLGEAKTKLRDLQDASKTATQSQEELASAISTVSPRLGALSGALTGVLNPMTAVAVGVAAIGAAAVGIVAGILSAAQAASEFGSKIFDASQKTNFQVETLSALDIIQRRNGSTLDALIPSLGIFQTNMVKASEGGNALSKTFKELNIDTVNQEKAFRQAISALSEMSGTEQQAATAKKLFGRAGLEVLAIVKETNGNLDEAIKRYEDLGLIISSEAAAAADAFGDSLEQLTDQLSAMARSIGFAVIPVLNVFIEDISRALTGNQSAWKDWRNVIEVEVALVIGTLEGLIQFIASRFTVDLGTAIDSSIKSLLSRADQQRAVLSTIAVTERAASLGARRTTPTGSGGGGRRAAPRDTALRDATREAALAERETLLITSADVAENKRALDEQVRDIEEFTRRAIELSDQVHDAAIVRINAEQEAIDRARQRRGVTPDQLRDLAIQERELTIRNTEAQRKNDDERFRLEQERDRKLAQAQIAAKNRELQIAEEADARIIARIKNRIGQQIALETDAEAELLRVRLAAIDVEKDAVNKRLEAAKTLDPRERVAQERELNAEYRTLAAERTSVEVALNRRLKELGEGRVFTASEAEKQITVIIDEGFKRRREALEKEELAYSTTLERREVINAELIRLDGDRAFAAEEAARRIVRAQFDEQNAPAQGATRKRRTTDPDVAPDLEGPTGAIDQLFKAINDNLTGDTQSAALAGLEAMTTAFSDLGSAVGQAVRSFVLFGNAGTSVRKVTAEILASVAQQAAVKAIFELAEGFAALALAFFGIPNAGPSAQAHFTAAAIYGAIAGVAAVAGRVVAGNAFKSEGAGGGATSGGGAGSGGARASTAPSSEERQPIDVNRTPGAPSNATLTLQVPDGWFEKEFRKDFDLNGYSRLVITSGK